MADACSRRTRFGLTVRIGTALLWLFGISRAAAGVPVTLPIEVTGAAGTTGHVVLHVPETTAALGRALRCRIHGIEYADMVSIQINEGNWISLNNNTAVVEEPGRSYGGIGGGFSTLGLELPLARGSIVAGNNTIRFRFNGTNGVVSGFRVLRLGLADADGRLLATDDTFVPEDPGLWLPPFTDAENIAAGARLWREAKLVANGLPGAGPIRATCSDCHTKDGRDLKYFSYSNASIVARSRFHGLSERQGLQIASYVRALDVGHPGRPWNPPYQPGPGQDAKPVSQWAAGAGAEWVLENDADTLSFVFPLHGPATGAESQAILPAAFSPDGDLNPREIPVALPLPDWNHWLPHVHPLDAWGDAFARSELARTYATAGNRAAAGADATALFGRAFFGQWIKARSRFVSPGPEVKKQRWTAELSERTYSLELWQLVKTWEMVQEYGLEGRDRETGDESGKGQIGSPRSWPNAVPAATAPAAMGIPDDSSGMGGSALTNEYFNAAWYELQIVLNSHGPGSSAGYPVDWVYLAGRFQDLRKLSGRSEPGRLTVALIKAMQAGNSEAGPGGRTGGWRPERNIDPRIMVAPDWATAFSPLAPDLRRQLTEAFLAAWLDKTLRYPASAYFQLGKPASAYEIPAGLRSVAGGRAWEAKDLFLAAGVRTDLVRRLEAWGRQYMDLAELYHY